MPSRSSTVGAGAPGTGSSWLPTRERGHEPIAVDLPTEDDSAGWWDYADTVVEAVADGPHVVVVGQSLGCFTAPLVSPRRPVDLLVLVAGTIPSPGESFTDWWANSGYEDGGFEDFYLPRCPARCLSLDPKALEEPLAAMFSGSRPDRIASKDRR